MEGFLIPTQIFDQIQNFPITMLKNWEKFSLCQTARLTSHSSLKPPSRKSTQIKLEKLNPEIFIYSINSIPYSQIS